GPPHDLGAATHDTTGGLYQKAAARGPVRLAVGIDLRQNAAGYRDVDLLGASVEARNIDIHHGPYAIGEFAAAAVLCDGAGRRYIAAVFDHSLQVQVYGFLHGLQGLFEGVAGREAAGQVGHRHAVADAVIGVQDYGKAH